LIPSATWWTTTTKRIEKTTTGKDDLTRKCSPDIQRTDDWKQECSGIFWGVAAAARKLLVPVKKVLLAKGRTVKQTVRAIGENRPLAFASKGAMAGEPLLPNAIYYGAWGLSISAIGADICNKQDDAPNDKKWNTVLCWTAFHLPASLVVPAVVIQ